MIFLKNVTFLKAIDGFTSVEYLIIFNAIIYGFITSYYFSGWGSMIQNRKKISFSYEHIAWTVFTFINLVTNWYGSWHRVEFININIWYFFFSLIPPLTSYFIAVLLFPNHDQEETDYSDYLSKNKKILFGVFAGTFLMSIFNGVAYKENDWVDTQNMIRAIGIILASCGIFINHKYVHILILSLGFFMMLIFLFTIPSINVDLLNK